MLIICFLCIASVSFVNPLSKNYVFKFPTEPLNHLAAATLSNITFPDGTKEVSVSMWLNQAAVKEFSLLTYGDGNNAEMFRPIFYKFKGFYWYVNGEHSGHIYFPKVNEWNHLVATWKSEEGLLQLFINGTRIFRQWDSDIAGGTVNGNGILTIGQNAKIPGNQFQKKTSFNGQMTNINIWDRILNIIEVRQVFNSELEGNIVAWSKANWTLKNGIEKLDTDVGTKSNIDNYENKKLCQTNNQKMLSPNSNGKISINVNFSQAFKFSK